MAEAASTSGVAQIKRCAWLGAKISSAVMVPIAILLLLLFNGTILYKSIKFGVNPLEVFRLWDARLKETNPTDTWGLWGIYFMPIMAVLVTVVFCTIMGALIGAAAAGFKALRGSKNVQ